MGPRISLKKNSFFSKIGKLNIIFFTFYLNMKKDLDRDYWHKPSFQNIGQFGMETGARSSYFSLSINHRWTTIERGVGPCLSPILGAFLGLCWQSCQDLPADILIQSVYTPISYMLTYFVLCLV